MFMHLVHSVVRLLDSSRMKKFGIRRFWTGIQEYGYLEIFLALQLNEANRRNHPPNSAHEKFASVSRDKAAGTNRKNGST
jgi:hypothetical protein